MLRIPRRFLVTTWLMLLTLFSAHPVWALEWPQQISTDKANIVIYQPQPEQLVGNQLTGRAAMSIEMPDREAIFGALWFQAQIDTDRAQDQAIIYQVQVTKVTWPDSTDANEQLFIAEVAKALAEHRFEISLSRLTASLAVAEKQQSSLDELNTDPPNILFSQQLAVLLLYDGEAKFSPIENSPYQRAMNTPFAVIQDPSAQQYYLTDGGNWYQATNALGPWLLSEQVPSAIKSLVTASDKTSERAPQIISATEPTELVISDGKPNWVALPNNELMYVQNSETPWLRELATGNMYLLLSGRWYRAKDSEGPWTFVRADELPSSFSQIPPASDIAGVRTAVAGTDEAEEAIADAQIPQTAAIKRAEAKFEVQYDGPPKFERIAGTEVAYAINTGAQVLLIDEHYYAVDNGVWFESASATGPWAVADTIPSEQIAAIPPSSPVYNTTYVHIYESTPEVVYVGYTPGYLWSFPYYGVPVYGTGWYYRPFWGNYYYPRPPTWGFHVGYNPWTGWNIGVGISGPFYSFGYGWSAGWSGSYYRPWGCCSGWGGGHYHGGHNDINIINNGNINIGNNINFGNWQNNGHKDRLEQWAHDRQGVNLYRGEQVRHRLADNAQVAGLKQARADRERPNTLITDRDGNVLRKTADGWQQRDNGGHWRDVAADHHLQRPETKPAQRPQVHLPETKPAQRPQVQLPETKPAQRPQVQLPETKPAQRPQVQLPQTKPAQRPAQMPNLQRPAQRDVQRPAQRPALGNQQQLNREFQARERGAMRERAAGLQRH